MGEQICEPNVYLFAFHLVNSFTHNSEADNFDFFLESCNKILQKFAAKPLDLRAKTLVSLPIAGEISLDDNSDSPPLIVTGSAHPLWLHDSYSLGLNIGCPEPTNDYKSQEIDITQLGKLNPDNCFSPDFVKSSLGQTLLITAELTKEQKQQGKQFLWELADECIQNFFPQRNQPLRLNQSGELLGSPIFEYGIPSQSDAYPHVLIWLLYHPDTESKFEKCYQDFITLFYYRNKIIQSYQNSRDTSRVSEKENQDIENLIDKSFKQTDETLNEAELQELRKHLKTIPQTALEYAQLLRDLEDFRHTIAINNQNYLDNLERISDNIQSDYNDSLDTDLSFLKTFSQKNCRRFQEQIQADLGYLVHGSGLLDKAIASIRGIVEIDQDERDRDLQKQLRENELAEERRDRNLETTIAVVGVGLGVTEIIAGSSPYLIEQNSPKPIQPPFTSPTLHPFTQSLLLSLFFGVAAAGITWGLITLWHCYSDPKAKNKPKPEASDRTPNK